MPNVFPFEEIGPDLDLVPLAGRRGLDHAGLKLSLEAWRTLSLGDRQSIVDAGASPLVDVDGIQAIVENARVAGQRINPVFDPSADFLPDGLEEVLREVRPLDPETWAKLPGLHRFAVVHALRRAKKYGDPGIVKMTMETLLAADKLSKDGLTSNELISTHLGPAGDVRMIDVAEKATTRRRAVARSAVRMKPETAARLARGDTPKGEVLATARIAGIMAAKRTPELIPMCHAIALTHVAIAINVDELASLVTIEASAEALDRTGVEMEAMVAASIAALTIYDMLKGIDREMVIEHVALMEKSGGRSGHFRRSL